MHQAETPEGPIHGFTPHELLGKPVYDLNGIRLGRVTRCLESGEEVRSFDVELRPRVRDRLRTRESGLRVDPAEVVAADEIITLREAGEVLLHPEAFPPDALRPDRSR